MRFAIRTSLKNIRRKPFRTMALAAIVAVLSFVLFAGAFTILSLQRGLQSYRTRLGADIVVVPSSASGHGSVDDILLQGITGNYYMSGKDCGKVFATEGIESAAKQFFLTSAKASCCSSRVQIIGFDPETDFSVLPWIGEAYDGTVRDGDIIVGSNLTVPADREIRFYGQYYHVAARLAETGTGLDTAVYTNMRTMKEMAENASRLLETSPFQGVNIETAASAILIRVADGYSISDVADDINIHITKVEATPARSMISGIVEGLGNMSRIIGLLIAAIWVLAVVILAAVFALLSHERKKEFAVFRVMGASQSMLSRILCTETAMISACGAVIGLIAGALAVLPLMNSIRNALGLPVLAPGGGTLVLLVVGSLLVSVLTGFLTSAAAARRITGSETALLLREDT